MEVSVMSSDATKHPPEKESLQRGLQFLTERKRAAEARLRESIQAELDAIAEDTGLPVENVYVSLQHYKNESGRIIAAIVTDVTIRLDI
jgi:DNA-binding phage protein